MMLVRYNIIETRIRHLQDNFINWNYSVAMNIECSKIPPSHIDWNRRHFIILTSIFPNQTCSPPNIEQICFSCSSLISRVCCHLSFFVSDFAYILYSSLDNHNPYFSITIQPPNYHGIMLNKVRIYNGYTIPIISIDIVNVTWLNISTCFRRSLWRRE